MEKEKYTKEEIIGIIENEIQEWKKTCEKLCKNYKLIDKEKNNLRTQTDIRMDTLDTLKYRF